MMKPQSDSSRGDCSLEISGQQLWTLREISSKDVCFPFLFHFSLPPTPPIPEFLIWILALINTIIYSSCLTVTKKAIPGTAAAGCLPWDVVPHMVQASLNSLFVLPLFQWSGPRWWGRSWWRRGPLARWSTPSSRWRWVIAQSQAPGGFGGRRGARFLSESLGQ